MALYRLLALTGEDQGKEWVLQDGRNIIGRAGDVRVQLLDTKVSRHHCAVDVAQVSWLEDLGSLNSTLLNGSPVTRSPLAAGDRLTVGDTELQFAEAGDEGHARMVTTALQQDLRERKLKEFEREMLSHGLVGRSQAIVRVLDMIGKVARTDATVLITGPSGSGKELVANALHYNSPRRDRNIVSVNCAALPETLLESELFGYEKGAFTGAGAARSGKFQYADGGTIFLDEIGDMPLGCQAKILRVLQDRSFSRLGSNQTETVDSRVVAATNRNLEKAVEEKTFREDLLYRINVINIDIPALAKRREDIEMLAGHFLEKFCSLHSVPMRTLSPAALAALNAHDWPGNVRELQNCIERAVLLSESTTIEPGDMRLATLREPAAVGSDPATQAARSLKEVEKEHVLRVLEHTQGNKKRAAEILGIERNTLYDKLRLYGLRD